MFRRLSVVLTAVLALVAAGTPASAQSSFRPGAAGIGDPYFPLSGNGGYDVKHYDLDVRYTPGDDRLAGVAVITARATQDLSAFNLDFHGLTLRSVEVDGRSARFSRSGDELTVTPRRGLRSGRAFTVTARYDGVPGTVTDQSLGDGGVFHTDDGMVIVGQPFVASTWFPANDHPRDKASYTVRVTVPRGLEAVSNGVLKSHTTKGAWTTWLWDAKEPLASYLATATVGEFNTTSYTAGGVKYFDAVDPDLFVAPPAHSGTQLAISGVGEPAYKRLSHTIDVPAGGGNMTFWVNRNTEQNWDFFFVEAHTVGADDWTTLPDANGHSSPDPGRLCGYAPSTHPFLLHYLTPADDGCAPTGTSGAWNGASGVSNGYEQWSIDLSAYAGKSIEVSLSYENDPSLSPPGVFVDDINVSTGQGTTSFEADGDTLDGWVPGGPPEGSEPNPSNWTVGTVADEPPTVGSIAARSLAREPEIIKFESDVFGPYPFTAAGGIVDDVPGLGFALENQTRPIYAREFFTDKERADGVLVHELAHQWYGDSLSVRSWSDIWLNEGFATYAEWLWSEREGLATVQEYFDANYSFRPAEDDFWTLKIGDPGPGNLFDGAVYDRGAMTLHALRLRVGDAAFFRILKTWAQTQAGRNVATSQFVALSEQISGQQLDDLFNAWLFTASKPALAEVPAAATALSGPIRPATTAKLRK